MKYWAILDQDNRVIGEWLGPTHWVKIFEKKSEAKQTAISLNIPKFQIVDAVTAMQQKPSQLSQ
ncbi:hypothetical protein VB715_18615 [Crocosphaera sp. UHCC 0190]|uniref:hypothetical protein n=1 Tax=Crocosphaera sp. UHCC 0190 TaxID=3110246 RepID=UPI002B1FCB40|nr:hypothetical protein [Crocosphaera sp. UHCC 0190]MEA5511789.1 hypothetical protein [Crocosphaera sp. UHCC 0190]